MNSGYPYHGEPSPPPELIWVNSDLQALPIEWIRVDSVAEVRDDAEIIRARYRVVTLNLAEGGFFDELGFFQNLLHDKITGNNVVYFPIAPLAQGVPLEIPVFGAVTEAQIVAAHLVPKETITGNDSDYMQLKLVNKDTGAVICTKTFLSGVNAPAYEVTDFGPVDEEAGAINVGQGVSFAKEEFGAGMTLPRCLLIIEWNLR